MKKLWLFFPVLLMLFLINGCSSSRIKDPVFKQLGFTQGNESLSTPPSLSLIPGTTSCRYVKKKLGDPFIEIRSEKRIHYIYWYENFGMAKDLHYIRNSWKTNLEVQWKKTDQNMRQLDLFFDEGCVLLTAYYMSSFP